MTLSDGTTTLTLRGDIAYPERYRVQRQRTEVRVGDAVVVQEAPVTAIGSSALLAGDVITMTAESTGSALLPSDAAQLRKWSIIPGKTLTLAGLRTLPTITVLLRSIDLYPIWPDADANPAPYWFGTVSLMAVGAAS